MKESETITEYSDRLIGIVNNVRLLGNDISDSRIVQNLLVTIPERFETTISSLENLKDPSTITLSECGQLGHVEKICKSSQQQGEANDAQNPQDDEQMFVASCFTTSSSTETWLIDSGCTNHMSYDRGIFKELHQTVVSRVKIGNWAYINVEGKGIVAIEGHTSLKFISDVLYVPEINQNLLSVAQLLEKGYKVLFEDKKCIIKDAKNKDVFNIQMKDKSFVLDFMQEEQADVHKEESHTMLWHGRLGHFHHAAIFFMKKNNLAKGLPQLEKELHAYVGGPIKMPSLNGSKYYIAFIDDFARFCWIYFMKFKSEVADIFWKFKAYVETQSGCKMQVIKSDNGTEYTSEKFNKFCQDAGIEHQLTAPYTPQQNGVVERKNRTIMDMVRVRKAASDKKWMNTMKEELNMIEKNQTWELVDRPNHKKAIGVKWVYRTKLNPDGSVHKYKARLVVKGYAQMFGVDFSETFSPVARMDTVRLLLALSAQKGWLVHQMDVKSAFLNGYLKEEIFIEQPQGFTVQGEDEKVYRLKKTLYGLKQAPRSWYSQIDAYLLNLGFEKCLSESTLYIKKCGDEILVVSLYVDDLLVTGTRLQLIKKFKDEMKEVFEMTYLGEMTFFLGMQIRQKQNEIFVCQQKYAKEVLKKFNMEACKSIATPMNQKEKFSKDDGAEKIDDKLYRSLIGCLMYLTTTRSDIMHDVSLLSSLHGYSDSDWAGCVDDMRSTSGNCFSFGSGIFSWSSKKQEIVAQSTAEAEYVAATAVANQALWIRKLLTDLHMEQEENTHIFLDNQAAISIANNPVFHGRTKLLESRWFQSGSGTIWRRGSAIPQGIESSAFFFVFGFLCSRSQVRYGFFSTSGLVVVVDGSVFCHSVFSPFLRLDLMCCCSKVGSDVLKVSSVKGFICLSLSFQSFAPLGFHGLSSLDCLGLPIGPFDGLRWTASFARAGCAPLLVGSAF
ncbi:hypothetical protein GQ457_08G025750 [Hibiscus cannabinus]